MKIICYEVRNLTLYTGFIIAKRIVAEVNPDKICSANVDGGKKGKKWLVKLSNNPLEFID